ncbi:uncharacterized protein [Blastocystis hominis]|uniref:AAA+ ATPase domain-containing protein n=1 Tax=Blastocystis hominis TaxID=12968 RepID=D8LZY1_BLAHO|nr:uncharacterized protein [Blastocystis hominis]CBK21370.2 unnamed protein product [Blastocystis hominis]|eukprot:XP_012895418.1 uncharacterized protein [Blastocystis hominis]
MRPTSFAELQGNEELFAEGSVVRTLLEKDPPPSFILCGPSGCGKTTVAYIISKQTTCPFKSLSCCTSDLKEVRSVLDECDKVFFSTKTPTILFLDEIHRFSKNQQDVFLPYVESGKLVLIGATTENPSFSIIPALLSRCRVFPLQLLSSDALLHVLEHALATDSILRELQVSVDDALLREISLRSDGDARRALNSLESCVLFASHSPSKHASPSLLRSVLCEDKQPIRYDRHGEEHFNCISALHKSMRGSDVHAALYWLSRMLEGGEDPLYVARRLIRFATEDVGLADLQALSLAVRCYQECEWLGRPLCFTILAQCVSYLALTAKSNELYLAYGKAVDVVHDTGMLPIPQSIQKSEMLKEEEKEEKKKNAEKQEMEEKNGDEKKEVNLGESKTSGNELYRWGESMLPQELEGSVFMDVERALRDLREPSLKKAYDTDKGKEKGKEEEEPLEEDANKVELPLEKRARLELKKNDE